MELQHIDDSDVQIILRKSNVVKMISLFDIMLGVMFLFFVPYYGC